MKYRREVCSNRASVVGGVDDDSSDGGHTRGCLDEWTFELM